MRLSEPHLKGREREYVTECVETGWVSSAGSFVARFEQAFAEAVGARHAVACASGTAALHLAMRLAGVERGDEVWVSTLTFAGSINPILYQGGVPVLVDSEPAGWNLDCALVLDTLNRRLAAGRRLPKAIEVVHVLGVPAGMDELVAFCGEHGIDLIEDAAEALGASYTSGPLKGRQVGTIGRLGCYSFNGNKVITCGGGGMVVTDEEAVAARARHLTTQARLPGLEYRHDEVGYNYRLTNLAAAVGTAQLEQLDTFLAKKRAIARAYDEGLRGLPGLGLYPRPAGTEPSFWLYSILISEAAFGSSSRALISRLAEGGVEARPLWTPLHRQAPYAQAERIGNGAVADRLFAQGVSLPSSVGLTSGQQDGVIDIIRSTASRG